jgi:RNA polymerase sigma-70 factor (ECF subfamily)
LARKPRSWEDFVDRFIGLVIHVINHTAQSRSVRLTREDREDLASEVFLAILNKDFAILRRFRGESSLATYLTVVARRVVVRELRKRKASVPIGEGLDRVAVVENGNESIERVNDREQVERLIDELTGSEADVVRLYHLEGKSYREISSEVGISENSIGPTLSRARDKMRRAAANIASS